MVIHPRAGDPGSESTIKNWHMTPWSIIPWLIQREGTNFDGYVRHFGVNQAKNSSGANVSCTRRHCIDRCCANILWNGSWDLIDLDFNGDSSNLTKVGFSKQKMRSGLKDQSQTKMFRPKFHRLKEDWSKFSWLPIWLVVLTILKNISQWEGLSHILWKIKNVWNHQPAISQSVNHHSSSIRTWRWCHPTESRARAKTSPDWRKPNFCCPRDPAKHLEVRLSWGVFWAYLGKYPLVN